MKQSVFTTVLIFAFCFAVSAQSNISENSQSKQIPKLLTEYNDTDNEWYKLTVELIGQELINNPSATGLIRVKNDNARKFALRVFNLKRGISLLGLDSSRIIFLIVDKQEHDTDVLVASDCSEIPNCKDCIAIRALDIDKISIPSKSKKITNRRKNK